MGNRLGNECSRKTLRRRMDYHPKGGGDVMEKAHYISVILVP